MTQQLYRSEAQECLTTSEGFASPGEVARLEPGSESVKAGHDEMASLKPWLLQGVRYCRK